MKLRKLIAVLSAVMMLCAIIPMGALTVSAEENLLINGDFEIGSLNGWSNYSGTTVSTDVAHTGTYSMKSVNTSSKYGTMTKQTITVTPNTEYTLTYWYYYDGTNAQPSFYTYINVDSSNSVANLTTYPSATKTWGKVTLTFNSKENSSLIVYVKNRTASDGGTYYFDDFMIPVAASEPETPDEPGNTYEPVEGNLLQNPSFETGSFTGWSTYSGTTIVEDVVHSGKYGIKSVNTTTEWGSMTKQTVSVKANTDYILTYWYYYDGSDASASFYAMVNNSGGSTIKSTHVKNMTPNTWTQVTVEFNSTSNTSIIVYAKNGTANSTGTYYFDDFVLLQVGSTEPEEPEQPGTDPVIPNNNLISNSTFETGNYSGWTVYNGTAVSTANPHTGSYGLLCKGSGWNGIAHITFNTEVGKSYQVSFWYYIETAGFNWKVSGENTGTSYGAYWQNTNLGSWQQIVVEFIADDTKTRINISGLDGSSSPVFYIDDVYATEVLGPSNDGFIVNGDFEVGKTTGWSIYQSTKISAEAAHNSAYGINLIGNGGWGGMLKQSFKTTKGLKYVLTLDVKVINYGTNMQVRNSADDANLVSRWFNTSQNAEWATYTFEFTAISTDTYLNFCGGGGGSSTGGENVYVDNIKIVEIPCDHQYDGPQDADCNVCGNVREVPFVDIFVGDDVPTSASEDINGLGFKFEIESNGAATDNNNKYTGTATIRPYGNSETYTLIAMGAVVTNNADAATNDMLNLNTVNGKKIINVEAVYLCETDADSLAFAIRIVNIPNSAVGAEIYVRPYYVFEKDGETIVIYDDIVSESLADVMG